jgi:hypothetical protein
MMLGFPKVYESLANVKGHYTQQEEIAVIHPLKKYYKDYCKTMVNII